MLEKTGHQVHEDVELTILMPCLNEAETLARCIAKAHTFLARNHIVGEVLIADNGSTDGSQKIAEDAGARVIAIPQRGYGSALLGGIKNARGTFIIMGDCDDSYDFLALEPFVARLREGHDLVMGKRFRGGILPGAMPRLHRYLGNPVLTFIGRLFFRSSCGDFHCGLRGFRREAMLGLDLRSPGMEFASEMIVKATLARLSICEVPTILSRDGRSRPPHLRSWRDGWRHLRFLLIFSPRWLFLYPGLLMFVSGLLVTAWLLPQPRTLGGVTFDIHTMLYASLAMIIGMQSVMFWLFAKVYGMREGIVSQSAYLPALMSLITLERGLLAGAALLAIGLGMGLYAFSSWDLAGFGTMRPTDTMRLVIPSVTAINLALQIAYGSFFVSVLEIRGLRSAERDET